MDSSKSRKRKANWSELEKEFLIENIKKRDVITSSNKSAFITKQKEEAWKDIARDFQRNDACNNRESEELKCAWKNMIQRSKNYVIREKLC